MKKVVHILEKRCGANSLCGLDLDLQNRRQDEVKHSWIPRKQYKSATCPLCRSRHEVGLLKTEIEFLERKLIEECDVKKELHADLTLKVQYIEMFVKRGYVKHWLCAKKDARFDPRYIYIRVVVDPDYKDEIEKYSTTCDFKWEIIHD